MDSLGNTGTVETTASLIQRKRFANELKKLNSEPLFYATAYPDESNPLIWYFLLMGQKDTPYEGGEYIGKIMHSPKYPAEPPDYMMLTPSGRYETNRKICLTNSSYHKSDWSSTWNIISILIGFNTVWLDDNEHGISHITNCPKADRQRMARDSIEYNRRNNLNIYTKFDRTHLSMEPPKKISAVAGNVDANSTTNPTTNSTTNSTNNSSTNSNNSKMTPEEKEQYDNSIKLAGQAQAQTQPQAVPAPNPIPNSNPIVIEYADNSAHIDHTVQIQVQEQNDNLTKERKKRGPKKANGV